MLILADDFTGACDAAGAFGASQSTLVLLDPSSRHEETTVLALDLDLRERTVGEARSRVEAAVRQLSLLERGTRVFLKIDSTLRGPIGGLVDGALAGSGKAMAVVAPAFPEQGRLLEDGRLLLGGEHGASLIDELGSQQAILVRANVAGSRADLERAVERARLDGFARVVVDTDDGACLESVAAAWQTHPEWLLVGSAGLARRVAPRASPIAVRRAAGPLLVVAGSPAPATRAQLERLGTLGGDVHVLCSPPAAAERDNGEASQAVADATATWASSNTPGALILTGGTTARLVCQRLGAHGMRVHGELAPGVPVGHLTDGVWEGVAVVTKAGGFGVPDTLVDVALAFGVSSSAEAVHD